jgi:uncharacterized DUF497 family protein
MRFDWHDRKAASNRIKHGVSFEEPITAFDDPFALIAPDPMHSTSTEERRWLIGEADTGVLVVVFAVSEGRRRLPGHQCTTRQPEGAQTL